MNRILQFYVVGKKLPSATVYIAVENSLSYSAAQCHAMIRKLEKKDKIAYKYKIFKCSAIKAI